MDEVKAAEFLVTFILFFFFSVVEESAEDKRTRTLPCETYSTALLDTVLMLGLTG